MNAREVQMRFGWVKLYEETGDAGYVCRRCGITRPTLRKWVRRYKEYGIDGLHTRSKKPHHSPNRKIDELQEQWILELRTEMNLGARRIQNELVFRHGLHLSTATIHKVLTRYKVAPLVKPKRKKKSRRYEMDVPGERVQMDTCKIMPGMYQFTAIDDCTRYLVAEIYPRRTATNTLLFLEKMLDEMYFPIQRIQTDRGTEFFAYKVQERLFDWGIKFRPNPPGTPHLNGKVERAQKTMLIEFYATENLKDPSLSMKLAEWQHFYNWFRVHGSLGTTPIEKLCQLFDKTPYWEEVEQLYDPEKEFYHAQSYMDDVALQKLKRCL